MNKHNRSWALQITLLQKIPGGCYYVPQLFAAHAALCRMSAFADATNRTKDAVKEAFIVIL